MNNRFQISFRQKQFYLDNDPLQPVVVQCNIDGTAEYVPGLVPLPGWTDVTRDTQGLDKIKLNWSGVTEDTVESGDDSSNTNELGSNYQKGLTANLRFFGAAFQYIFDWLMTEPCQSLNCVEVLLHDNECDKYYRIFEIKLDNTAYSPNDEPCIVELPLREADSAIHVFQKTAIEDNWQGWFNEDGTSTKDHPTFGYLVEKKPKFAQVLDTAIVYTLGTLYSILITSGVVGAVGFLLTWDDFKEFVRRMLGICYFCPSPLIRTYIENVCGKYGFTFDTMFDDIPGNKYRDVSMFFPAMVTQKHFDPGFVAASTKFMWDNRTLMPMAVFLNKLKKVFNAEWYVTPNKKLIFQHKSFFDNQVPIYDFTIAGNIIYFLKYTFNGRKKPAYGDYEYLIDPQDLCSTEPKWRYNDIVDYDGPANNPMLEGKVTKTFDFAMTSFYNDGIEKPYIEDSAKKGRIIAVGALILGLGELFLQSNFITVAIVAAALVAGYFWINNYINGFFDNPDLEGMIRVSNNLINTPRLLFWDRLTDMTQAKVKAVVDPASVPYYNLSGNTYYQEHPSDDGVNFGVDTVNIYNYPMYVEANFADNLFDNFHEYDNPLKNNVINQTWEGQVDLCCEWLERLGVFEGQFAKIGAVVVLEKRGTRLIKGRITDFDLDYDTGIINLKGNVLR